MPPVGLEPTHLAPEARALSTELRGQEETTITVGARFDQMLFTYGVRTMCLDVKDGVSEDILRFGNS